MEDITTGRRQGKISKDLIPIVHAKKITGPVAYFNIWIGLSIIIATFAVGGEGIKTMELAWVLLACLIGNILLGIFLSITGDIGIEHGISFPVYIKALFGANGIIIPAILRAVYGAIWFGIQTYFGALAINVIVSHLTGFDNWLAWYIIFAVVQVINTAFGFHAIEKFANIAAPCIIIIAIYMCFNLMGKAGVEGIDVWHTLADGSKGTGFVLSAFLLLMIMNMTYWASSSADSQNLTRYLRAPQNETNWLKRNRTALTGHMLALPVGQTFMIAVGAIAMVVVNNWNPIEAMQAVASGAILAVLLLMVVLAQWSTNAGGNLYPPAIVIVEITRSRIGYPLAVVITGIIGSIFQPWELINTHLSTFLGIIGTLWASFAGMSFADYYLIRKRRLNIPDLYNNIGGQYHYAKGWNLAGIITLVVSMVVGRVAAPQLSYFIGFAISAVLYILLATKWWFKKYPQAEQNDPEGKFLGLTAGRDWLYDEENNRIVASK